MIRDSFPAKLLVLLLAVGLLIGGIGGFIYFQTGESLEQNIQSDMQHSTQVQANTLGEWVERNHNQASTVATDETVRSGSTAEIEDVLEREEPRLAHSVMAIHYVDTETGEVVTSSDGSAVGVSYEETRLEGIESPGSGESTVTNTYEDPTTGVEAVAFVAGVDDQYAIVMPVDLQQRVERLERPANIRDDQDEHVSFTHVVNSEGYIVLSHEDPINNPNMGDDGVDSMAVMQGLEGDSGYMQMEMMGHDGEMAMGFAPIEGTDWVIMTHIPASYAFALQEDTQWAVLTLILVSIVGLGIVGVIVGRSTTRSLRRLSAAAEEIESGNLSEAVESGRTDEIGQLYVAIDSMRQTLKTNISDLQEARENAEHERERVQQMNADLEDAAQEYCAVMGAAADGNLTVRADVDTDNEQMATIGEEFNEMLGDIEQTIGELREFARVVATASEEVTASSEEVRSASQQVSESVQEISDGAKRQHDSLRSVNSEMENLSTTTEEIAASSNQVADLAEQTAETGSKGREAAQRALAGISTIETNAESTADQIEALEREVNQVDDLIDTIQEIAEQTNMLALNANIEASRGTGGGNGEEEGFGVVAQEVKALSEDAKEAANEVEQRLEAIQKQTNRSSQEVQNTRKEINKQAEAIQNAAAALQEIAGFAEETNTGVQEISAATEEQAATTQEVVAMIDDAASISEQTTSEAEGVAAAAEEQTTAMSEVSQSASQLAEQAGRLSEALDKFETDAEIDPETVSITASEDPLDPVGAEGEPIGDDSTGEERAERTVDLGVDGEVDEADPFEEADPDEVFDFGRDE